MTLFEEVTVFEPEDGIAGRATVASIDNAHGLLYLDVDWASMDDDHASPAPVVRSHPVLATSTPASRTSSSYTRPVRVVTTTRTTRTVGTVGGRANYGLAARGSFTTGGGSTVLPMMRQGFR
ncbi:hypothetical protein I4I73_17285 [Pseudonocardia sp. KRD-184]|uniref:Uncharacterized protein n=1 Tax=Pseudonocardia oceani TaxID=2792013 RepID=A0ABS6U747_9PSEU|nr:hypothetical protein [Pseudonocardia oceani]MBW0090616.1 hypothetical protein [Pseudonocardia oceani]MBW0097736.1 hypothetical protein [Pseudonocardia oceani]MBW0110327.1 hypothetical protein [Pseudonocardia oceani]MBW0120845.1 hypothetical protein [Pseudonocardia oceani]MBW0128056.1 hypothetical protein [Pseudonocardia oceani]